MKIRPTEAVKTTAVEEGASKTKVRWLIAEPEGAPNFALRLFELEPGGYTPRHRHPWEHEVFILEGKGDIAAKTETVSVKTGDAILIEPGEEHQFRNVGDTANLRFLCIVPLAKKAE
jgi:quercetin dioxygenase-like cupin family protein